MAILHRNIEETTKQARNKLYEVPCRKVTPRLKKSPNTTTAYSMYVKYLIDINVITLATRQQLGINVPLKMQLFHKDTARDSDNVILLPALFYVNFWAANFTNEPLSNDLALAPADW